MDKEKQLEEVYLQFDKSANDFCRETGGSFCEITSSYNGEETLENLESRSAKIFYNAFIIEFKYSAHLFFSLINSVLECRVYFEKGRDVLGFPLPFVVDAISYDTPIPLCVPLISDTEGMVQAYDCLGGVLKNLLTRFEDISTDEKIKAELEPSFVKEVRDVFNYKDKVKDEDVIDEFTYDYYTFRFSTEAFINFIRGNRKKAVKQLGKVKRPTGYEKRMMRVWSSNEAFELPELSAVIKNAEMYGADGVQPSDVKELGVIFFSWLLLTPVTSAVYVLLYFILVALEGRNSVYLMGTEYNFPYCFLFGFVTAIALSYFTRFKFYKFLHKKDYEKFCEFDTIQNGVKADRTMRGFIRFIVLIGFIGCLLLSKWNLNFYEDGFKDNTKFLSFKGEYYSYTDIDKVYYMPNRVNAFGDTLEYPSYVLVLKDGREIDFFDYDEIEKYGEELIDFLRTKGVKIED